ncbi:MAG: DUF5723 family protein [Gemmatimonadota bacterium]
MNATKRLSVSAVVALAALSANPAAGSAQLANASARTLGMAGTTGASARGFAAISVNPAGLGMPGNPGFSLAIAPVQLRSGLDPVTLADLKDVEGILVPTSTKDRWLSEVQSANGQRGSVGVDISELALSVGRIGFQVSTLVSAELNLSPGVVQALLYGNAGRTGQPEDISLTGSTVRGYAVTTAGVSLGFPLPSAAGSMALGATLKYSVGHGLILAEGGTGTIQADPVRVDLNFPAVMPDDEDFQINNGTGVGLDVGFMMQRDRISVSAAVLNLFNTFAWETQNFIYRPGTARLEEGNNDTDFEKRAYSAAPAGLRSAVDGMTFDPVLALGGGYAVQEDLSLTAEVRNRFGDGLALGPKFHAGVGAEYRGLKVLHLRGGAALVTDGFQFGGGATLALGPVNLSAAGALRTGDLEDTTLAQFTLSFGGR